MTKRIRMWVDPVFKKKLKLRAVEEDISMEELTRKLGKDSDDPFEGIERKNEKKKRFDLGF